MLTNKKTPIYSNFRLAFYSEYSYKFIAIQSKQRPADFGWLAKHVFNHGIYIIDPLLLAQNWSKGLFNYYDV